MTKGDTIYQAGFGWVWDGKFYGTCDAAIAARDRANEPDKPKWGEWKLRDPAVSWDTYYPAESEAQVLEDEDGDVVAYRIRIEPVRVLVAHDIRIQGGKIVMSMGVYTHRFRFTTIDGKPDTNSIRMEEIGDG